MNAAQKVLADRRADDAQAPRSLLCPNPRCLHGSAERSLVQIIWPDHLRLHYRCRMCGWDVSGNWP